MSEVSFEIVRTRGDVIGGMLANTWRSPGVLGWYLFGALLVAIIAATVNSDEGASVMLSAGGVAFVAMSAFYALIMLLSVFLGARKVWNSPGALEPISYVLSSKGLTVQSARGRGETDWSVWKTAFETRAFLIIRHHLGLIHILPKRSLESTVQARIRSILNANLKGVYLQPAENAS